LIGTLYSERPTWLHRWPAGAKLLALSVFSTALFALRSPLTLVPAAAVAVAIYLSLGRIGGPAGRRPVVAALLAGLLLCGFHWTLGQAWVGAASALRLLGATCLGVSLTLTTRFDALLRVLERLFQPLQRRGLVSERLPMMLALMVRFTEHFFVQWQKLDDAYRLRTGRAGGVKILGPLCIQMLQTAQRVGDALEARLGP
jgi:biotin transport system permease protein